MSRDFTQINISPILEEYFGENFRNKWNLSPYNDPNKPSVFLGWYNDFDYKIILNHKSPMIFIWGGGDMTEDKVKFISNLPNSHQIGYGWQKNKFESLGVKYKEIIIPIKDFTTLPLSPLGENIYVYKGIHGNRPGYFKWDSIVNPLIEVFGKDRVIYSDFQPIDQLVENFYKDCFVYVKPNEKGGSTTMWELGYMGRKTITSNQGDLPNILNYSTLDDVINHIVEESKKIGTLQPQIREDLHNIFMNTDEWLYLNYYE